MVQYLADNRGVLDTSDDVHGRTNAVGAWMRRNGHPGRTTADPAGFHVNVEYPFQSLSPGHRHMTLRRCFLILIRCQFPAALAPPGRGHPHPVLTVRRKDTVTNSSGMNLDNRRLPVR